MSFTSVVARVSPTHTSIFRRCSKTGGKTTHNKDTQCFQMKDLKVNPPFHCKPHLKWGSVFLSSWKNILWVGGWIRTVRNCCHHRENTSNLEEQRAGKQSGILPGQPYVRSWAEIGQTIRFIESQIDRKRRAAPKKEEAVIGGTLARLLSLTGGGICCLWGEELRGMSGAWSSRHPMYDAASLKNSNLVFPLTLLNLFTHRFHPTCESCSEAVSHQMIWCGFIKKSCVSFLLTQ